MYTTESNPILADYRDAIDTLLYETHELADSWAGLLGSVIEADSLDLAVNYGYDYPMTMDHVRHAHKVMTRLATGH